MKNKGNKKLLITGGTGSFGNAVLNRFVKSDNFTEIRILSRDEKKQDDLRKKYNNSKVKFYIGDVRDTETIESSVQGVDYVFHAAALKQVPSCEFFPMEALKTNVIGTANVIKLSKKYNVEKVVCLSTDKAAYPINAMGMSKALMEKIAIAEARDSSNTEICITRYGNVMGSRGSVIPLFINQILNKKNLTVTDPNMTRFLMTLDEAVDLVLFAFNEGKNGETFVQKSPASTIGDLCKALLKLFNSKNKIDIIGTRHGEKLYETLCTKEEMMKAISLKNYYRIPPDFRGLNYESYFEKGASIQDSHNEEYNSHNTERLEIDGIIEKLREIDEVNDYLK